jgi:oxygen-independent coproporphyrinogen-3 oxidase
VDPEISFEALPGTLTPSKADLLKRLGINRISIGIQSFVEEIATKAGRPGSEKQALQAIDSARATGAKVNLDLLSGLAGETRESWRYSLERALSTAVESITVYKLEMYSNTEYARGVKSGTLQVPSDEDEVELMRHALERFEQAGYLPQTTSIFGKGGEHPLRHIVSKWKGLDNYAFGVSAFGSMGSAAYQNTSDMERYSSSIQEGRLPIYRGYELTSLDLMRRDLTLGMKLVHFDHREFLEKHGVDVTRLCSDTLAMLQAEGYLEVTERAISLTSEGVLYGDYVAQTLGACMERLGPMK